MAGKFFPNIEVVKNCFKSTIYQTNIINVSVIITEYETLIQVSDTVWDFMNAKARNVFLVTI